MISVGEFELIRRYFASATCSAPAGLVELGIGDDCALLVCPEGQRLAVSTDTLVESVHFPSSCEPELLASRALGCCVSDLAAMGADPLAFTLALTLPVADASWLEAFSRGLCASAEQLNIRLVGGDTTRGPLSISLTVMGLVPVGQALLRKGAEAGDLLCVGGTLGEGKAALELVSGRKSLSDPEMEQLLLDRYWRPLPQLTLGALLRGKASAALDLSDGLLADCRHIAEASGVRLVIEAASLPCRPSLQSLFSREALLQYMLCGGDDYRLIFTLPARHWQEVQAACPDVSVIGRVEQGEGILVLDDKGRPLSLSNEGYQHFGKCSDD